MFIVLFLAFVAASAAAVFTGFQAWIVQDTAKRQLRAYLNVRVPPNALRNFGEGKIAHVQGIFENSGQTPAYRATWKSGINVSEFRLRGPLSIEIDCQTIMSQSNSAEWFVEKQPVFPWKERDRPFTTKEVQDIQARKAAVYFQGRVCYLDIFEEVQVVDFCIYWAWDGSKNHLDRAGTYCRYGNGPPQEKSS